MDPLKMEQTKTNTVSDLDWVRGIGGSQKEQFKNILKDMMKSCYESQENITDNLSTASEVILKQEPKKIGDCEILKDNDISRCYLYIDLGSNADILFKHLLLDSQRDMDTLSEANIELVKLLVEMENKLNEKESLILFDLLENCANRVGLGKAVDVLLERKANQQVPNHNGLYPMHLAVLKMSEDGNVEELSAVIESMIKHKFDINVKNEDNITPLHYLACGKNDKFPFLVKKLLDKGADPSIKDAEGYLPIHFACGLEINGKAGFISNNRLKILGYLLKHSSPVDDTAGPDEVTPLHCCLLAMGSTKEAVIKLLGHNANPNISSKVYGHPIHLVCIPFFSMVKEINLVYAQLMQLSNIRPDNNSSSSDFLYEFTQDTNIEILKILLKHNAKVDVINPEKRTALHIMACSKGKKKLAIEVLFKYNAKADFIDKIGAYPIHYLCGVNLQGRIEPLEQWDKHILNWFLQHGGDINSQMVDNNLTPLHTALIGNGKETNACIEQLLHRKANPNMPDKNGIYPIHLICGLTSENGQLKRTLFDDNRIESLKVLVKNQKTDLNIKWRNLCAPIHLILTGISNVKKGLHVLLEYGANANLMDGNGMYPLHLACEYQSNIKKVKQIVPGLITKQSSKVFQEVSIEDLVQLLIKNKAEVNKREERSKMTALHRAIINRNPAAVIEILLQNKAEVDATDQLGIPPILYTFDLKYDPQDTQDNKKSTVNQDASNQIVSSQPYGLQYTMQLKGPVVEHQIQIPLRNSLYHPYIPAQIAQLVPSEGQKISDQKKQFMTNVIQLLLDYDVNLNFTQTTSKYQEETSNKLDLKKRGVLHFAVLQLNYDTDLVKKILEAGANPNLQDADGLSPLHYACKTSIHYPGTKPEDICIIVDALLENGADPNLEDKRYNTPLHYAVECGIEKIVEQLLKKGADWTKRNLKGLKPVDLVKEDNSVAKIIIDEHIASVRAKKMNEPRDQEKMKTPQDEETKKLNKIFLYISKRIVVDDWKHFLRYLEPHDDMDETESFISDLDTKPEPLHEKIRRGLVQWKRSKGTEANILTLIQNLEDCELLDLAQKVEGRFLTQ